MTQGLELVQPGRQTCVLRSVLWASGWRVPVPHGVRCASGWRVADDVLWAPGGRVSVPHDDRVASVGRWSVQLLGQLVVQGREGGDGRAEPMPLLVLLAGDGRAFADPELLQELVSSPEGRDGVFERALQKKTPVREVKVDTHIAEDDSFELCRGGEHVGSHQTADFCV